MTNKKLSPAKRALLEKWRKGKLSGHSKGISRRTPEDPVTLSFPQQRQLFLELLDRGTAVNNLSALLDIKGRLDLTALEQSANQIIARHEVLRTRFILGMGLPTPEVLSKIFIDIPFINLKEFKRSASLAKARQLAEKEVLRPFNLTQPPLVRLTLFGLEEERQLLLLTVHHIIADGWSLGVFLQELIQFYRNITTGQALALPELPIQYADFAQWQTTTRKGALLPTSMDYWEKQLGGPLPVLELPTARPRAGRQTFSGGTHRFVLTAELTEALKQFSQEEGGTLFMTLLTAFYILLHRYSGQDDILVGTPIANRNLPELEPLIGVFINTLVLRINLANKPSFRELFRKVKEVSLEAYAHQDLPFEQLVEALKPQRDLSRTPLFQVVFNLQNAPMPQLEIPGLEIDFLDIDRGVSQFDLTLMMTPLNEGYHAAVEFNEDLFDNATIIRMFRSFLLLLSEAAAYPDRPVSTMQILSKEEKNQLVHKVNETQFDFPRVQGVHQLFEAQVTLTPEAEAISCGDLSFTYLELNRRANILARKLQAKGVGPGIQVGILMERSVAIVEALLAVFKAGGTYVPLHPSYPVARIQYLLENADVQVVLTNLDYELPGLDKVSQINLIEDRDFKKWDDSNLSNQVTSTSLAYIIYTSGSTGLPKGVMISHTALTNFLWSMRQRPGMNKDNVLLSVTPISFDIAALELFLPLIVGAKLVMASEKMMANPLLLAQAIEQYEINMMQATPATWQLLLNIDWVGVPGLKALCGGDVMTRTLANQLLQRVDSLWNMYGPTETTIWSSVEQILPGDRPITIGAAIGNTQLYIFDRELQVVPVGVIGELYIGGLGLADGYLKNIDLTRKHFIPNPFYSESDARLYKTGDLARYLPDHSIELLGRKDDQVKVNGHRIELGEITAVLVQHPSVDEGIVMLSPEASGDKRLVAFFVPKQGQNADTTDLRGFLKLQLPNYMIPSLFVLLERLPLTPNGKIDRKSLPMPGKSRQTSDYLAPRNETERILAGIWQTALNIERVGVHDNFFELGGASIQSLEIVARANMFGFRIGIEQIFEFQTVAELAEWLE